jgi:hypothetical protein
MNFVRMGNFLAVTRETGNQWNLLMVRVENDFVGNPVCERLPGRGAIPARPLVEAKLIDAVLLGVSEANERLGTRYKVSHIKYVEDDIPPESIYTFLTASILEHLHEGREFRAGRAV